MIAQRGPDDGFFQDVLIYIEDRNLILGVGAGAVGVVTEHQPQIGVAVGGELVISIANLGLQALVAFGTRGAGVADYPSADGLTRTGLRRRDEMPGAGVTSESLLGIADGIVILGG